jgi:hypothetical protein
MNGGARLLAGVAAVALVVSALGLAAPSSADAEGQPSVRTEVTVNR